MNSVLIKNATVITLGDKNQIKKNHDVLIKNNIIDSIFPTDTKYDQSVSKIIDATGKLVMPGFINAHTHFYSSFARGFSDVAPSKNFNEILDNLWWRLDKKLTLEDSKLSAMVHIIDGIRKGTTTIIDHHASPMHIDGSLNIIKEACEELGVRASLCYEVSDRDGMEIAKNGLWENQKFIESLGNKNEMVKGLIGLHAAFTLSDETLQKAGKIAKDLKVGCHIHTAEAESDQEYSVKNHSMRVVERLMKFGILGDKSICAHCTHLEENEFKILKDTNTMVAINHQSNMNNAVGVSNIKKMIDMGILVGLGTDAMTANMLEELRTSVWMQKLNNNDPGAGFMECSQALTINNAKIANRYFNGIGELKAGKKADMIILSYQSPTEVSESSFLGHLVFGLINSSVDTTIVNGKILMEDGQITITNENKVFAEARKLSGELWDRI